jgi:uncharacterized protein DUF4054
MPYTIPTYSEFITRFPIFDNAVKWPQAMVELVLTEAANNIDTDWFEADYQPAIMYQTAHLLSTDNSAAGTEPEVGLPTFLSSESFAGMSSSYSTIPGGTLSQSEMWGTTVYGRRYLNLLRKNKPAVVVA